MYKLSPSDFAYLWNDCKHCFYQKVKNGILLPTIGFPGVFTKMNNLLQNAIMGMNFKEINPDLPSGVIAVSEGYLKSKPIPPANDCFISGRFDILSKLDDGNYSLIDFKITDFDEEKVIKYSKQLHGYRFALENPESGEAKTISKMGLVVVSPQSVEFTKGEVIFKTTPKWFEVKVDMDSFYTFVSEISQLLNGPVPEPTPSCNWCQYRTRF